MRLVKIILYLVLAFGLPFLILFYFARFSIQQSIVLALIVVWLCRLMATTVRRPTTRFKPYYVSISPKWYELLTDFKLIAEPEEWRLTLEKLRTLPFKEYRILSHGVIYSVVHEEAYEFFDPERVLVFLSSRHDFATEINVEESMDPINIDYQSRSDIDGDYIQRFHGDESSRSYIPQFFIKNGLPGGGGSWLGIIVPDWWWERKKVICPKPVKEDFNGLTGEVEIVLAQIPASEFDEYRELVRWSNPFLRPLNNSARRDEERTKLGWNKVEHSDDNEVSINWPETIEHKYFRLEHNAI